MSEIKSIFAGDYSSSCMTVNFNLMYVWGMVKPGEATSVPKQLEVTSSDADPEEHQIESLRVYKDRGFLLTTKTLTVQRTINEYVEESKSTMFSTGINKMCAKVLEDDEPEMDEDSYDEEEVDAEEPLSSNLEEIVMWKTQILKDFDKTQN